MQLIFQDPLAALDRRMTIAAQIGEPLDIHGSLPKAPRSDRKVAELMLASGCAPIRPIAFRTRCPAASANAS
jgi:peptide/nickel transport system ATP-binding protein